MTLFIDPPIWPAHGTVFSHLISDQSTQELHDFADLAGITERAFDRDHYDVPERKYRALVAAGAVEVSGNELARILIRSGLRIPARRRNESLNRALMHRWESLVPGQPTLGTELASRWSEPHRKYHGRTHLLAILEALDQLSKDVPTEVFLAAWFHDAVYQGVAGQDEERSAQLAERLLPTTGFSAAAVAEVARLVRLTAGHSPGAEDTSGQLLCDADLSILGSSPDAYQHYLDAVREDYAHVSDADFATGRAAVVRQLLNLDQLFHTSKARELWALAAWQNLNSELAR